MAIGMLLRENPYEFMGPKKPARSKSAKKRRRNKPV
jgi:hypothetical protein